MAVVLIKGMLDMDLIDLCRPKVIVNSAFILGSSKQGNARRASTGSIWVVAKYLWLFHRQNKEWDPQVYIYYKI